MIERTGKYVPCFFGDHGNVAIEILGGEDVDFAKCPVKGCGS